MFCPFHERDVSKTSCQPTCPFYHKVDGNMEECLLANSVISIAKDATLIAEHLQGIETELLSIKGKLRELANPIIHYEVGIDEGEGKDYSAIRRAGEAVNEGTRTNETEGGNDGVGEGAEDSSLQEEGVPEERSQKSPTG